METRFKAFTTEQKMTIQLILAVILSLAGMAMLWVGMFVPPVGIIDPSVLTAFGEISTFAGALIGLDYNYKYKIFKIDDEERRRKYRDEE